MVQSKGYHTMNTVSWFVTMRIVDWTIWKQINPIAALLLYFRISGIHPAAVKCPVSASLVGRSFHVKLSVRSIARSIRRRRNLIQRNQTVSQVHKMWESSQRTTRSFGYRVVWFWALNFSRLKFWNPVIKCFVWCGDH